MTRVEQSDIVENPACSAEQGSLEGMGLDNYVNWGEERASQRRGIRNSTLGQNLGDLRVIFSRSPTLEREHKGLKHLEMVILDADLCVGELLHKTGLKKR